MTGGVRDTLAAAIVAVEDSDGVRVVPYSPDAEWLAEEVLAALSSPEVVRVATEALTEHAIDHLRARLACHCGQTFATAAEHAAHQWSVLVSELRGEQL